MIISLEILQILNNKSKLLSHLTSLIIRYIVIIIIREGDCMSFILLQIRNNFRNERCY